MQSNGAERAGIHGRKFRSNFGKVGRETSDGMYSKGEIRLVVGGKRAEELACYMNSPGKMYVLFPRSVKIPRTYSSREFT